MPAEKPNSNRRTTGGHRTMCAVLTGIAMGLALLTCPGCDTFIGRLAAYSAKEVFDGALDSVLDEINDQVDDQIRDDGK